MSSPDVTGVDAGARFAHELINLHKNYDERIKRLEQQIEDLTDAIDLRAAIDRDEESYPDTLVEQLLEHKNARVRVFREYRGLSQAELSRLSGVRQAMLSEIESGKKKGSLTTLKSLAVALRVDLDEIA